MDQLTVAKKIYEKTLELEDQKKELKDAITKKVLAQVEFDKAIASKIMELRLDNTPTSIVEKIAKGAIWEKTLELETAEGILKGVESNIRSTQAQLNGLQSVNRYFSEL
jgi:hypothetical protein